MPAISLFFTDNREVVEARRVHTFCCVDSSPSLQQQPFPTKESFRELPVKEGDGAKGDGKSWVLLLVLPGISLL